MPILLHLRRWLLVALACLLAGCKAVVLSPSGDVALQQRNLIIASTVLMLLIIVPVIVLTLLFAWRYRASNTSATYAPDWDHSTQLELLIWAAPLVIVMALGAMTWINTHTLDPYQPIKRIDSARSVPMGTEPLTVEVVALDWKWLFIYPAQGIATVNEIAVPVDVPVEFKITASSVMNSFFIPALAGQIYAMPGMETPLNAVINEPGVYEGFSANYSGAGFSDMRFKFRGMNAEDFTRWVQEAKDGGGELSRSAYLQLAQPSQREPVRRWGSVPSDLYGAILNQCVEPGKMCMNQMTSIDAQGGMGRASAYNVVPVVPAGSKPRGDAPARMRVAAMCRAGDPAPQVASAATIQQ